MASVATVVVMQGLRLEVRAAGTGKGAPAAWVDKAWLRPHDSSGNASMASSATVTTKVKISYKNLPSNTPGKVVYKVDGCADPAWGEENFNWSGTGSEIVTKEMPVGKGTLTVTVYLNGNKVSSESVKARTSGNNTGAPVRNDDADDNNSPGNDEWKTP